MGLQQYTRGIVKLCKDTEFAAHLDDLRRVRKVLLDKVITPIDEVLATTPDHMLAFDMEVNE